MIVGRQRVFPLSQHLRNGGWRDSPTWDKWGSRELTRSTVGLVGASNVGRHVISFLAPFETEILVSDPFLDAGEAAQLGVTKVELDELLRRSDTVSLHCPSNEATQHILNAEAFALMKDDALLINTARGELIDEEALIAELSKGRFFAFLDVSDPEPSDPNSPLRTLDNVVLTPHTAGCIENCNRMGELAVDELRRFFAGEAAVYQITPDMYARIS
jgi:phosphoglycerate dehydrogenase-like enzyme